MKKSFILLLILISYGCNKEIIAPTKTAPPKNDLTTLIPISPRVSIQTVTHFNPKITLPMVADSTPHPWKILFVTCGQSNGGNNTMAQMGVTSVSGVYGFNYHTERFEPTLNATTQFYSGKVGFQVRLAQDMKATYTNDSLYFFDWHIIGTNMGQWNIHTGANFFKATDYLDMILLTHKFDFIVFVWTQGEDDSKNANLSLANTYEFSEEELFVEMYNRYKVDLIIDYQLPPFLKHSLYDNVAIVRAAKVKNCGRDDVYSPTGKFAKMFEFNNYTYYYYPTPNDSTHLSVFGQQVYGDSIANFCKKYINSKLN